MKEGGRKKKLREERREKIEWEFLILNFSAD